MPAQTAVLTWRRGGSVGLDGVRENIVTKVVYDVNLNRDRHHDIGEAARTEMPAQTAVLTWRRGGSVGLDGVREFVVTKVLCDVNLNRDRHHDSGEAANMPGA